MGKTSKGSIGGVGMDRREGGEAAPVYVETLTSSRPYVRKIGYDERRSPAASVQEPVAAIPTPEEPSAHTCKTCGFEARTTHGLARHAHAIHGFGGVPKALGYKLQLLTTTKENEIMSDIGYSPTPMRQITKPSTAPSGGAGSSQGEGTPAGSIYTVYMSERPNLSNTRNRGPERNHSVLGTVPQTTMGSRATGRLG